MSNLRHSSPFSPQIRLKSEETTVNEESKLKDAEAAIQELKSLELLPLVLDIVEDVNAGKLLPKDVDNAAGTIRVRINKAREILRTIHGLAESPEERATRVNTLSKNITRKTDALQKFREQVGKRISLPDPPTPQEDEVEKEEIKTSEVATEQETPAVEIKEEGEDVKMEDSEEIKKDPTPDLQRQPFEQTDTFMSEDVNFDLENFGDFPTIGNQDDDINMDTS